ncbi:HPr family phosphocarrier protein [Oceanobacillus jeddahense]|uniref:HPr family phosphocarrier protein n=1 Tax=Oceanobacillus jeddahense TaxID=1462527 RepID=A0ABY5JX02_9BACI|nr:HPr family phosphocarrier protein [Oceanobacillus jeddahense]UUI03382.1 HPr family phosphocarrier protein [Oceanobacillus jeddahense]
MVERTVKLEKINDVKAFVEIMTTFDYQVDIISGRYVMDAKSILGIFSLDLTQPLTLKIHADECDDLLEAIAPYIVQE